MLYRIDLFYNINQCLQSLQAMCLLCLCGKILLRLGFSSNLPFGNIACTVARIQVQFY